MEATEVLLQLSRELRSQGCHLQAAKCLKAACNSPQALPVSRAVACLDYAALLLDHFDNIDLAKQRLLQAVSGCSRNIFYLKTIYLPIYECGTSLFFSGEGAPIKSWSLQFKMRSVPSPHPLPPHKQRLSTEC